MTTGAPAPAIAREQQPKRVESNQPAAQPVGTLLSVNVGLPKDVPWQGRTVFTGVFKDPVPGSRRVGRLNVDGDGQGDLAGHGGEQRAVFVYQIDSYRYWERELGRHDFVVRTVRRELHCGGTRRRRGVHWRSLPDWQRDLRGDATSRHLLSRRDPHERSADSRVARLPPPSRLLLPGARRGRGAGGRQNHQALLGTRADDRRRRRRAALPARAHAPRAAPSAPGSRPQPRLAGLVSSSAERGTRQRQRRPRGRRARLPPGPAFVS